jgi:hypothetical protein
VYLGLLRYCLYNEVDNVHGHFYRV